MEEDFYKTYFEVEKEHWWFSVRRNIIFSLFEKYKVPKTAKVFDFGCGSGYLVGELQRMGYDASGSDTSREAIEFGRQRGIKNIEEVKPAEMPQNGNFDVVLALDVIEHIKDDREAIRGLERALKPGGMLIITVPAYQWMWGVQDEVAHHFRRYNMGSLLERISTDLEPRITTDNQWKSVEKNPRLSVIRKTYFNTFLFLPIATVRLFSKFFGLKERESDFDINNKLTNSIFYSIFNLEAKLLKFMNFPFGVSILLILKKNKM